jgi:hypothetical protein
MEPIIYGLIVLGIAWLVGLPIYVFVDDGKEKPEGFETDVEHNPVTGKKLPKWSWNPLLWPLVLLYWLMVLAEMSWSKAAAAIRKMLGMPQK